MCKYCTFSEQKEPYSDKTINRGVYIIDDCDISVYLYWDGGTEVSLRSESYNGYEVEKEISHCPMCGYAF